MNSDAQLDKARAMAKELRRGMVETGSLCCLDCGCGDHCSTRGCAVLRAAADMLEALADRVRAAEMRTERNNE